MRRHSIRHLAAAAFTAVALSGMCGHQPGRLGDILGGAMGGGMGGAGQQGQVVVEVQGVDTRQQVISVRTQEGQQGNVISTRIPWSPTRTSSTRSRRWSAATWWPCRCSRRSRAPRTSAASTCSRACRTARGRARWAATRAVQQIYGRVGQIDAERGMFQLQTQQGTFVVELPYNPGTPRRTTSAACAPATRAHGGHRHRQRADAAVPLHVTRHPAGDGRRRGRSSAPLCFVWTSGGRGSD